MTVGGVTVGIGSEMFSTFQKYMGQGFKKLRSQKT